MNRRETEWVEPRYQPIMPSVGVAYKVSRAEQSVMDVHAAVGFPRLSISENPGRKQVNWAIDPVVMMGAQYCSWLLGFLLPSLWEAEVAVSATALLAATVALLLILDQSASNGTTTTTPTTSSPPPSTARIHHRDGRRRRSSARGKKAAAPELRRRTCEVRRSQSGRALICNSAFFVSD